MFELISVNYNCLIGEKRSFILRFAVWISLSTFAASLRFSPYRDLDLSKQTVISQPFIRAVQGITLLLIMQNHCI